MSENKSVVDIDEHNLDRECIRLPSDYLAAAKAAAEAKRDVAELSAELSLTEAELSKEIRADPSAFGMEKETEKGISAAIQVHKRYTKMAGRVREANHAQDLAQALVWALQHKKRALTLLVELHGMSYFSSPKVSEAGREAVERMTQRKVRRGGDDD